MPMAAVWRSSTAASDHAEQCPAGSNHAGRGAGMAVTTGVSTISVTFQGDSRIYGNQASSSDGGGIHCRSASRRW